MTYGKVKFGPLAFWMGKAKIVHFSIPITVCDMEMQLILKVLFLINYNYKADESHTKHM